MKKILSVLSFLIIGFILLGCSKYYKLDIANDSIKIVKPQELNLKRIKKGTNVKVKINVPDKKTIDKFTLNNEIITITNLDNSYSFNITKDIKLDVVFKDVPKDLFKLSISSEFLKVEPVKPNLLYSVNDKIKITLLPLPTNSTVDKFIVNGVEQTLINNQYEFSIIEHTNIDLILKTYSKSYNVMFDNKHLECLSPISDFTKVPENTILQFRVIIPNKMVPYKYLVNAKENDFFNEFFKLDITGDTKIVIKYMKEEIDEYNKTHFIPLKDRFYDFIKDKSFGNPADFPATVQVFKQDRKDEIIAKLENIERKILIYDKQADFDKDYREVEGLFNEFRTDYVNGTNSVNVSRLFVDDIKYYDFKDGFDHLKYHPEDKEVSFKINKDALPKDYFVESISLNHEVVLDNNNPYTIKLKRGTNDLVLTLIYDPNKDIIYQLPEEFRIENVDKKSSKENVYRSGDIVKIVLKEENKYEVGYLYNGNKQFMLDQPFDVSLYPTFNFKYKLLPKDSSSFINLFHVFKLNEYPDLKRTELSVDGSEFNEDKYYVETEETLNKIKEVLKIADKYIHYNYKIISFEFISDLRKLFGLKNEIQHLIKYKKAYKLSLTDEAKKYFIIDKIDNEILELDKVYNIPKTFRLKLNISADKAIDAIYNINVETPENMYPQIMTINNEQYLDIGVNGTVILNVKIATSKEEAKENNEIIESFDKYLNNVSKNFPQGSYLDGYDIELKKLWAEYGLVVDYEFNRYNFYSNLYNYNSTQELKNKISNMQKIIDKILMEAKPGKFTF